MEAFGHALSNMQVWYAHPLITGFMTRSLPAGYESLPGYADRGWPTCESSWIALAKVKRAVSWAPVFDVVGDVQYRRQPPMTPAALARLVASKRFTSKKGDLPMVIELNTRTIISLFRDVVELGYTGLDWGDKEMVQLCKVLPFCRSLTKLLLYQNKFGDESMIALAGAVSKGALPQCTSIELSGNPASLESKHAVKDALKRRWLDGEFLAAHFNEATSLDMSGMEWGDAEMTKLAAALIYCHAKGALARCTLIDLSNNPASDESKKSVQRALKDRWLDGDFIIKNLSDVQSLNCSGLGWGDAEMLKLASAIEHAHASGALPKCTDIGMFGNPASDEAQQAVEDAIASRQ